MPQALRRHERTAIGTAWLRKLIGEALAVSIGCGALVVISAPAFAQSAKVTMRDAARSVANQAADAYDAGDYEKAAELFQRAYALVPVPSLSIYLGRSLEQTGKLLEALDAYRITTQANIDASSPEPFRQAVQDAEEAITQLEPRIPRLTIVVSGEGADDPQLEVTMDGRPVKALLVGVEFPVNPGEHQLQATTPSGARAASSATFREGQRQTVELQLKGGAARPAPAERTAPPAVQSAASQNPSADEGQTGGTSRTWGYIGIGFGAASFGVGIVTGVMAASKHSAAEQACGGFTCTEGTAGADKVDAFRSLRTVSTVGYVVGVLSAGAGAVLLLTQPTAEQQPAAAGLAPYIGAGSVGLHGRF